MTSLDLAAVALVCATAFGIAWVLGERWYAHRDRAYHRLTLSAEVSTTLAIEEVKKAARQAAERIEQRAVASITRVEELDREVQRLLEMEQERARNEAYGRRG